MKYRDSTGRFISETRHYMNESNRKCHKRMGTKFNTLYILLKAADRSGNHWRAWALENAAYKLRDSYK